MFIHQPYFFPKIEQVTFPNGTRYYVSPSGKKYSSVTTLLGQRDKKQIDQWRKRVGDEEADRKVGVSVRRGKSIHTISEDYLNNVADWDIGRMPSNLAMFHSIKPQLDKHLTVVHNIEFSLYSDVLKIAGTADLFAQWDSVPSIIDYKTSAEHKREEWIENYFWQTSLYAAMIYERISLIVPQIIIIIMCENDSPQIFIRKTSDHLKPAIIYVNKANVQNPIP